MDGLEIIYDCNENQKMLANLPDWLSSRWNRKFMEEEEHSRRFPSFSKFVTREAKFAFHPITSLHALKPVESEKSRDPRNRGPEAKVLATNLDERAAAISCVFCEGTGHSLHKCYKFIEGTVSDRVCARKEDVLWLSEVWPPLKGLRKQNDLPNV